MRSESILKSVSKLLAVFLDFPITSPIFIQFTQTLRHIKDIIEHYILSERFFDKNENEEENEEEKFQLLYFFMLWIRNISIDSPILPHHKYASGCPPKWLFFKIADVPSIWLTAFSCDLSLVWTSIGWGQLQLSPRIIIFVNIHFHICDGEGLGNLLIYFLSM